MAKKVLNAFGYRNATSFIKLDHGLLKTEAWQTLSPDAAKVLLDLWKRHNGQNNGAISYARSEAHGCLCRAHGKQVSRRRADAALSEIQRKGFVVITQSSSFNLKTKAAREWRLTAERAGDDRPTRDFKNWKIKNTGTETVPDGHRDGACEALDNAPPDANKHRDGACNGTSGPLTGTETVPLIIYQAGGKELRAPKVRLPRLGTAGPTWRRFSAEI